MYAIQLTRKQGQITSWWCEVGFGAERFRKIYLTEADAQRQLNYCLQWAYRHHKDASSQVSVKSLGLSITHSESSLR
jgi:hypothetical protein